jgi:hypothetical protein
VTRKNLKQAYVVIAGAGAARTAIANYSSSLVLVISLCLIVRALSIVSVRLDKKTALGTEDNTKQLTGGLAGSVGWR